MPPVLDETRLAHAAAAGDGQAFAQLYDAYEARIFTFCHRIVGTPQDAADATQEAFLKVLERLPKLAGRELNFGAYLFTAARNASYDVIGKRKKADSVDEIPEHGSSPVLGDERAAAAENPEQAAMLGSLQAAVQEANARLPERQREVLALRELEELSYDEIAQIMEMNRNSVAQLISRARIKLRDELRGSALQSIAASSPDCERALPLIAMRQDGQLADEGDRDWLRAHLAACDTCRVSVDAMEEAGLSYRAWLPVVPVAWLWKSTMAKAAELTGADWSEILERGRGHGGNAAAGGASGTAAGAQEEARADEGEGEGGEDANGGSSRRRRAGAALLGAILLLLLLVTLVTGDDNPPVPDAEPAAVTAAQPAATISGTTAPARKPGSGKQAAGSDATVKTTGEGAAVTVQTPFTTTPAGTSPARRRAPVKEEAAREVGGGKAPVPAGSPAPTPATSDPAPEPPPADPPPAEPPPPAEQPTTTTPPAGTDPPDCRQNPGDPRCQGSDGRCGTAANDPDCPRGTAPGSTGSTRGKD